MATPILPDQFKNLIPNPNAPMCDEMSKALLQFPEAFWQWYNYYYNADGTISTAAAQDICVALTLIGCASGGSTTTSHATSFPSSSSTTPHGSTTTTPAEDAVVFAVTDQQKFITVNLATGAVTVIKTGTSTFFGLAQDPTNGTIYGLVLNGSNIDLVTVNATTGAETVIAATISLAALPTGLTFDSAGLLYCQIGATPTGCATNGALKTINKSSGAVTAVGATLSRFLGDICFVGSTLFAVGQEACFTDSRLFTVNTTTAAVSTVAILAPGESAGATSIEDSLAYVNGILYKTRITEIAQINTGTGALNIVATYDSSTNGRIRGMALNQ